MIPAMIWASVFVDNTLGLQIHPLELLMSRPEFCAKDPGGATHRGLLRRAGHAVVDEAPVNCWSWKENIMYLQY